MRAGWNWRQTIGGWRFAILLLCCLLAQLGAFSQSRDLSAEFQLADSLRSCLKYNEAAERFESLAEAAIEKGDFLLAVNALNQQTDCEIISANIEKAWATNRRAASISANQLGKRDVLIAEHLQMRARLFIAQSQLDSAERIFQEVLFSQRYDLDNAPFKHTYFLANYAYLIRALSPDSIHVAIRWRRKSIERLEVLENVPPKEWIDQMLFLVLDLGDAKKWREAEQAISQIQKLSEKELSPEDPFRAKITWIFGEFYRQLGDLKSAIDYAEMSAHITCTALDSMQYDLIHDYNVLSILMGKTGDFAKKVSYQKKALQILEYHNQGKTLRSGVAYNNLAIAYDSLGQPDKMKAALDQAMEIYQQLKVENSDAASLSLFDRYEGTTSLNLSRYYRYQKNWIKAHQYLDAAASKWGAQFPVTSERMVHIFLEEVRLLLSPKSGEITAQRLTESRLKVERAVCNLLGIQDFEAIANSKTWAGQQVKLKQIELLQTATDLQQRISQETELADDYARASKIGYAAVLGVNRLQEQQLTSHSKDLNSSRQRAVVQTALQAYVSEYEIRPENLKQELLDSVYNLLQRNQSMLLRELMLVGTLRQENETIDSIMGIAQENLEQINSLRRAYKKCNSADQVADDDCAEIYNQLMQVAQRNNSLWQGSRAASPNLFNSLRQKEIFSLSKLQNQLDPTEVVMRYFFSGGRLHCLEISNSTIQLHDLGKGEDIHAAVASFLERIAASQSMEDYAAEVAGFNKEAAALFELLLPVNFSAESMVIVPDGILSYLPFETLCTAQVSQPEKFGQLAFLLRESSIRYAYSTFLLGERSDAVHEIGSSLAFAPFSFKSSSEDERKNLQASFRDDVSPLPHSNREVDAAIRRTKGKKFLGYAATESVFHKEAPDFDLLHIASHGFVDIENPELSRLLLHPEDSEDGSLFLYELASCKLSNELTIISACHSGTGKLSRGEGVMSLARGFIGAGSKSVVTSLWAAEDFSTANIVKDFYEQLDQQLTKTDALRQAKLAFIAQSDPIYQSPYYWSNLVLVGDGSAVIFKSGEKKWNLISFVVLLLAIILFIMFKRN